MGGRECPAPPRPPTFSPATAPGSWHSQPGSPPSGAAGPGRAGADPGIPDAAARARGWGDWQGTRVGTATMEFRQEEFRKLAGRALGKLHR